MNALRVAVDATPLLGERTGVGAFVAGALDALAGDPELELDLSAYALSSRGGRALAAHLPPRVRVLDRPMPAGPLLQAWARADQPPAEWWTGPVDVVHGTNFTVPPTRSAGAVVTVHDLTPLRYPQLARRSTRLFPRVVRRALARGALVHTPSAFVAAEVVELLGADPARVQAVHHGVPAVPASTRAAPARTPAAGVGVLEGPYVLALGTVEPRKDLPGLVAAFDAIASAHVGLRLVVAGPDGWGVEAFDAALARATHADRVVRLGWVEPERAAALLAGAAVLAFPSLYEGFGLPPLEAMAAGVPVVATRAGALPEVLGDAACLVPPGDHDALAEALALVLGDDEVRAGLVARGREQVARFSWQHCAAGLAGLYRRAQEAR